MKICFPIRDLNGKEFTSVDELMSLINSEAHGTWLLGANGLWHGGIHISDITQPFSALNKDAQNDSDPIPLQFMADGTVVAYRVNDVYQTAPYCGKPLRFSSSFVLVKSVCQPDPAKSESLLEFYSLYMHLAAVEDYPKSPCYKVSAGHNGISVRKYIKGNHGVPEAESTPQYSAAYNAPAAVGGIKVNEGDQFVVSRTGRFYVTRSRETKLLPFGLSRLLKDGKLSKEQYWITLDAGLMERNGEMYDLMPGWMNQAVAKGVFNSVVNTDGSDVWKVAAGSPVGFMGLNEVPGVGQLVDQERFVHLEVISVDSKMPAFLSNPASVTTGGKLIRTIAGKKMHLLNAEANPPTFTASEVVLAKGALVSRESTSPVKDAAGKWWFKVSDNGWMPQTDVEEIEQYDLLKQGFYPLVEDSDGDIMHTFMEGWVSEAFGQVAEVSEGNNSGPLSARVPEYYRTMMDKLDENKDGKISADEIRRALSRRDPQVRNIIDRLVIKHHSEWIGGPSEERWKGFYKILDKLSIPYCTKWQSGHEWMSQVGAFKEGNPIWHMHPVIFTNALKINNSQCYCYKQGIVDRPCQSGRDDVTKEDFELLSEQLGVEREVLRAIAVAETGDKLPFKNYLINNRNATILYERHYMKRLSLSLGVSAEKVRELESTEPKIIHSFVSGYRYGTDDEQYERLVRAREINYDAANMSCSWGKFQVMGEYYHHLYESTKELVDAQNYCAMQHLQYFKVFLIKEKKMLQPMKDRDWLTIARKYNGTSQVGYDVKIERAYNSLKLEW